MDTTQITTHVSLCAGYGGIDLGLRRAIPSLRTIAFSEIEAFACANLVAKMEAGRLDAAPIWTDVKTFPWAKFCGKVDILSGGYPCQPFSAAGKRLGKDDPRHLWPWIADGIRLCQPALCFFENVEGHITLGLRDVLGELGGLGYRATWGIFSAAECGASHQRKRVFILAHRISAGLEGHAGNVHGTGGQSDGQGGSIAAGSVSRWPSRPGESQHRWEPPRVVGDTTGERSGAFGAEPTGQQRQASFASAGAIVGDAGRSEGRTHPFAGIACEREEDSDRPAKSDWRQTQPALGGDPDGPAGGMDYAELSISCDNRTDELRLLGNGVVPATAERAFRTLLNRLTNE